jgi:putative endonuclease
VFCEVKTRTSDDFGLPAEAVTRTKQARLRRLAVRWLREEAAGAAQAVRFDVASVLRGRLEVIEGAF